MYKFFVLFVLIVSLAVSQSEPVQVVKGNVTNFSNLLPVPGARVVIQELNKGGITKSDGSFSLKDVPPGRYFIQVSSLGYEPSSQQIVVTSGKQVIVNIKLMESFIETEELVVSATRDNYAAINEAVLVSNTQFTVDEAQRYAGSRMDPARMAQNFAGVLGANDTRNDIIIRGGAPTELLWRIDGLDIPNPNHFATQGATGGPVSAVNTMVLDNSDFLTGAYPAEYIDRMSGVFDLRTRRGNMDKYEYIGQWGFNGVELGAEGPLNKNASFLANYRYSFLDLLEAMGVDFGFSGIPKYQDATLKYDWDINSKNRLSYTGLFGLSDIFIKESETGDAFTGDFDINNGTDFLANVINLRTIYNEKLYGNLYVGYNFQNYRTNIDSITTDNNNNVTSLDRWFETNSSESYFSGKYVLSYTPNRRNLISFGTESRYRQFNFQEERLTTAYDDSVRYILNESDNAIHQLSFVNWNIRATEDITFNFGLSSQYLSISEKMTLEPRAAMAWRFADRHSFSLGWGIYNQSLPLLVYYTDEINRNLDFMQSVHYVVGYNYTINEKSYIKAETYLKDISQALIDRNDTGTFSFLNSGTGFGSVGADEYRSDGLGKTYGAELSYFRNFADGYYITSTFSYVRQQYKAADGKWRWGAFDNQYIFNFLAGYELVISPTFTMEFAGRYTLAGGAPYTPLNIEESILAGRSRYDSANRFSIRATDYQRLDFRIDFRQNLRGWSIISYFSIENILNNQNFQSIVFDAQNRTTKQVNQLGFFPVGGVRFEF